MAHVTCQAISGIDWAEAMIALVISAMQLKSGVL